MSVGAGIFPSKHLNSQKTVNISGIRYLSNRIFKFLKNNKSQWDKVSFQQNLQILKNNKYQRDTLSFQKDLQILEKS